MKNIYVIIFIMGLVNCKTNTKTKDMIKVSGEHCVVGCVERYMSQYTGDIYGNGTDIVNQFTKLCMLKSSVTTCYRNNHNWYVMIDEIKLEE